MFHNCSLVSIKAVLLHTFYTLRPLHLLYSCIILTVYTSLELLSTDMSYFLSQSRGYSDRVRRTSGIGIADIRTSSKTYDHCWIKWCKSLIYIENSVRMILNDHSYTHFSTLVDFSKALPTIHLEKEYLLFYHHKTTIITPIRAYAYEKTYAFPTALLRPRCILLCRSAHTAFYS